MCYYGEVCCTVSLLATRTPYQMRPIAHIPKRNLYTELGVNFEVNDRWDIRAAVSRYPVENEKSDVLLLALVYNFSFFKNSN